MAADLFDFWAGVPGNAHEHPADKQVLDRAPHSFQRECLPNPFFGPLRTARVVFLFLSPGFHRSDLKHAREPGGQSYYAAQRTGNAPLPSQEDYEPTWAWWNKKIGGLGFDLAAGSSRIAFLNINAYKSKTFKDWHMLAALPSSRACLDWAQSSLFPEAVAGKRVVVCLRSANHWGLRYGHREGDLFAPYVNRAGHMYHVGLRPEVKEAVARALAGPAG